MLRLVLFPLSPHGAARGTTQFRLPPHPLLSYVQGSLHTYRNVDNVWTFILTKAAIPALGINADRKRALNLRVMATQRPGS